MIDKIDSWRARQFALPDSKMHDGLKYLKNQWPITGSKQVESSDRS
ncbi:MAG: hypothetical protein ACI9MR_001572, partial [Myxococcota bacterium]